LCSDIRQVKSNGKSNGNGNGFAANFSNGRELGGFILGDFAGKGSFER
jgi:hypothetical protein